MLSPDEGDGDLFFDSVDCLSCEDSSVVTREELRYEGLDYDIWMKQPQSVKERREIFMQKMGLACISSSRNCPEEMVEGFGGLERLRDSGGASPDVASGLAELALDEEDRRPEVETDTASRWKVFELSSGNDLNQREADAQEGCQDMNASKRKVKKWWKHIINRRKRQGGKLTSLFSIPRAETITTERVKVRQNKKKWMEFSAVYMGQEIKAHKGLIWTMKFSPDGQYLASGGEDGVVRIWCVKSLGTCIDSSNDENNHNLVRKVKEDRSSTEKKGSRQVPIVIPNEVLQIEEVTLQEIYGHSSDVLDLAWSNSNLILSSSKDKTVRLWQVGCDQCLGVFHHTDYVTCIQFNPVDEHYFISGSIDGKVRIWGVSEKRVVDWADAKDVITAICYQPDGKKFIVGSVKGMCRFYASSGNYIQLEAEINVRGKKTSGNKITGIQFCMDKYKRVMITSEDSKIRIFEGVDVVHKCSGLPKSGSQMSASLTQSKKHVVSVGEDSRVYIWNIEDAGIPSSRKPKSIHSCEYFLSEGASVAIPWADTNRAQRGLGSAFSSFSSQMENHLVDASRLRESQRFSLGNWFSMDSTCRGSMTWPEEKLPPWDVPLAEDECRQQLEGGYHKNSQTNRAQLETWGLAVVTAGCDGTIKTFHNFGLPVKV